MIGRIRRKAPPKTNNKQTFCTWKKEVGFSHDPSSRKEFRVFFLFDIGGLQFEHSSSFIYSQRNQRQADNSEAL
jgi:hypothetical protein